MRPWPVPGNAGQGAINGAPAKGSDAVGGAFMRPWPVPGNVSQGAINGAPAKGSDAVGGRIHAPLANSWQRQPGRY